MSLQIVLGTLGGCSSCCYPRSRGNFHYFFWDFLTLGGCWLEGLIPSQASLLLATGWGHASGFYGSPQVHACLTLNDWCWVLPMEGWHCLCWVAFEWSRLWWLQWGSPYVSFSHQGMYLLSSFFSFSLSCISYIWWYLNVVIISGCG